MSKRKRMNFVTSSSEETQKMYGRMTSNEASRAQQILLKKKLRLRREISILNREEVEQERSLATKFNNLFK